MWIWGLLPSATNVLKRVNNRLKFISHHLKQRDSHICSWKADSKEGLAQDLILRMSELQGRLNSKLREPLMPKSGP